MNENSREFQHVYKVLIKAFFIFLSTLGINISDLDYPPTQSSIMILDTVLNSEPSDKLRLLLRFCIQYFKLRNIPINKRLGCILYLLIQCSVVQGQRNMYTINEDKLGELIGNGSTAYTRELLLPWVKDHCYLQCPKNIVWDTCSVKDILTIIKHGRNSTLSHIANIQNEEICKLKTKTINNSEEESSGLNDDLETQFF